MAALATTLPTTTGIVVLQSVTIDGETLGALARDGALARLAAHSGAYLVGGWLIFQVVRTPCPSPRDARTLLSVPRPGRPSHCDHRFGNRASREKDIPMTRAEVQQGVKAIVIDILDSEDELSDFDEEDDFVEDLDMDSLQAVSMYVHLEKRFSVTLPENEMNKFRTLRSVVDVVMANLDGRSN